MLYKLRWLILIVVIIIPSYVSIIKPGFFPMQDDMQVFRLYQMDKCLKDGQIPCRWIPDGGYQYGYPQFNFYAPLPYYIGEIFHLIGFQFIDSIKLLIILGFIASAIGMYVLVKEFYGNLAGIISAVLYTYAPYKAQEVYVRGSLSEFLAGVFFPLILWSIYKVIVQGNIKYILISAISIAGLFLTHNILSFLFIPVIAFWTFFWLYNNKFKNSKSTIITFLLSFGLSAFFVLPMLAERQFVHVETLLGGYFDYRQHFVSIKQLFLSNNWGYGSDQLGSNDDLSLSTGVLHWVFGGMALFIALLRFRKNKKTSLLIIGIIIIELTVLFLMHEKSSFIWRTINGLAWLQFPWRFLALSIFLLSFLAGYVLGHLRKINKLLALLTVIITLLIYSDFFMPKLWLDTTDKHELTGEKWERQLTASIFDYLPIYAKLPPDKKAPDLPEIVEGDAFFESYDKGTYWQRGSLVVNTNSIIRLPLYDFPGMRVFLNDNEIEHVNNNCKGQPFCMGLITFNASPGSFDFKVILKNTKIRTIGNLLSLVSFGALLFLAFRKNEKIFK